MATSIFSPISGKSYSYGGFTLPQQTSNIFNGVNPYYINNTNTYTSPAPQPVAPVAPTAPVGLGDYSSPLPTSTLNLSTSPGYNGPYNQGSPLSDVSKEFNFGDFLKDFDPVQTLVNYGVTALTGSPILGFGASQLYNNWDKMSFALEPNQVSVAPTYNTKTAQDYTKELAASGYNPSGTTSDSWSESDYASSGWSSDPSADAMAEAETSYDSF